MPKRHKMLTPLKKKKGNAQKQATKSQEIEESTPRGRLKGALLEVLEPSVEESDTSTEKTPYKKDRRANSSDEEDNTESSPPRQSYVLKLFDRSVDLSQFSEDSPLYPICRAWMLNQPKANYKKLGQQKNSETPNPEESGIELPGPEGPPVSKIPELIPEQLKCSKDNINLNYAEAPPPNREQLLGEHAARWAAVRQAWQQQGAKVEQRYAATQRVLNQINVIHM